MLVTTEEFISYFEQYLSTEHLAFKTLMMIYRAKDQTLTGKYIAQGFGMPHHGPLNLAIGRMGKKILHYTGKTDEQAYYDKEDGMSGWAVFFEGRQTPQGFLWILRREVAEALEQVYAEVFCCPRIYHRRNLMEWRI